MSSLVYMCAAEAFDRVVHDKVLVPKHLLDEALSIDTIIRRAVFSQKESCVIPANTSLEIVRDLKEAGYDVDGQNVSWGSTS